jgi:hypothetical protein
MQLATLWERRQAITTRRRFGRMRTGHALRSIRVGFRGEWAAFLERRVDSISLGRLFSLWISDQWRFDTTFLSRLLGTPHYN